MELHPGAAGHKGDTESSAVVEPASGTRSVGFAERQSFPERGVLCQLGGLTPANSSTTPRIADFRGRLPEGSNLQGSPENGFWMWGSMPQSGGDVARGQRPGRSLEQGPHRSTHRVAMAWRALTSRGQISRVPSGLSSHQESPPQVPVWSICLHPVHLFTSGGSSRVWNLRSSEFCSFVAFGAPVPLSAHSCPCSRPLDVRGHHWACVVGGQGCWGFEGSRWKAQRPMSAVRQGGVSVNVRVADLPPGRIDDRKIEVVADGLPHFPRSATGS